jgi:ribonucleoside-triphosphate reductase
MNTVKSPHITHVIKRGGARVLFDRAKIAAAAAKAMKAAGEYRERAAEKIADAVTEALMRQKTGDPSFTPSVEMIQDEAERALMREGFPESAKAYILYRAARSRSRSEHADVPEHVRALSVESKKYFAGNPLGEFVYLRTYAKWIEAEGRRET